MPAQPIVRFTFLTLLMLPLVLGLAPATNAETAVGLPCTGIQAVFFDLGDTLVEQNPDTGLFGLRPGVVFAIAQLQALDTRLGIITNVPADWELSDLQAVLEDPSFLDAFEVVVLSSQAPASKPDPAIYAHAYSLLNQPPPIAATAFVGETLAEIADGEPATQGAQSVGMVGFHLSASPTPSPFADYTIPADDLTEMIPIMEAHGSPGFCDGFESGDTTFWTSSD